MFQWRSSTCLATAGQAGHMPYTWTVAPSCTTQGCNIHCHAATSPPAPAPGSAVERPRPIPTVLLLPPATGGRTQPPDLLTPPPRVGELLPVVQQPTCQDEQKTSTANPLLVPQPASLGEGQNAVGRDSQGKRTHRRKQHQPTPQQQPATANVPQHGLQSQEQQSVQQPGRPLPPAASEQPGRPLPAAASTQQSHKPNYEQPNSHGQRRLSSVDSKAIQQAYKGGQSLATARQQLGGQKGEQKRQQPNERQRQQQPTEKQPGSTAEEHPWPTQADKMSILRNAVSISALHDALASWAPAYVDAVHLATALYRLVQLLETPAPVPGTQPHAATNLPAHPLHAAAQSPTPAHSQSGLQRGHSTASDSTHSQQAVASVPTGKGAVYERPRPPFFSGASAHLAAQQSQAESDKQQLKCVKEHTAAVQKLLPLVLKLAVPLLPSFRADTAVSFLWSVAKLQEGFLSVSGAGTPTPASRRRKASGKGAKSTSPAQHAQPVAMNAALAPTKQESGQGSSIDELLQTVCERLAASAAGVAPQQQHEPQQNQGKAQQQQQQQQHVLEAHHINMLVWAAAKLGLGQQGVPPSALWGTLMGQLSKHVHQMGPRDVCSALWAITTAQQYDYASDTFQQLLNRATDVLVQIRTGAQHASSAHATAAAMPAGSAGPNSLKSAPDLQLHAPTQPHQKGSDCVSSLPAHRNGSSGSAFNAQDLSQLVWVLGRTQHPAPPLLYHHLENAALRVLNHMTPQHMGNIAWGLAAQRQRAPRLFTAIMARAAARADLLPAQNMAELVWAAAKHASFIDLIGHDNDMDWQFALGLPQSGAIVGLVSDKGVLHVLAPHLAARMADLHPEHVPLVAWAYARTPTALSEPLFRAMARCMMRRGALEQCDHRGLTTILWSFTRQGVYDEAFLGEVLRLLGTHPLESVHANLLHMALWSAGTLVDSGPLVQGGGRAGARLVAAHAPLVWRIVVTLFAAMEGCAGQEVSNMAWALAQLGATSPSLWEGISHYVLKQRRSIENRMSQATGPAQEQPGTDSDAAQADGAAGKRYVPRGIQQLRRKMVKRERRTEHTYVARSQLLTSMKALECAKLVWAFAKAGHVDEELFSSVSMRLCILATDKQPRPLGAPSAISMGTAARTLWAYAMQGQHDDPVMLRLIPHATSQLSYALPHDVAAIMWALATSGHAREDDALVVGCIKHATHNASNYSGSQLADVLWAVATMWLTPNSHTFGLLGVSQQLVQHTMQRMEQHISSFRLDDIATLTWALTSLRYDHPPLWSSVAVYVTHTLHVAPKNTSRSAAQFIALPNPTHPQRDSEIPAQPSSSASSVNDTPLDPSVNTIATKVSSAVQNSKLTEQARPGQASSPAVALGADATTVGSVPGINGLGIVDSYLRNSLPVTPVLCGQQQGTAPVVMDAEHLVTLVHALANVRYFHPGLYQRCSESLIKDLDLLDTEHLVLLMWTCAVSLQPATAYCALARQQTQEAQAADAAAEASAAERHRPRRNVGVLDASCQLLRAAGEMLAQVAPGGRANSLTPDELQLLWQAHHCCLAWAAGTGPLLCSETTQPESAPQEPSLRRAQHVAPVTDPAVHQASPFKLHPMHMKRFTQMAGIAPVAGGRRRALAELTLAVEGLGYSTLGRATAAGDEVLAGCGPDWLGAEQGYIKLAVMLVSEEHLTRGTPRKLMGQHQVKTRLLEERGWCVVHLSLADWGQGGPSDQSALLQKRIHQAVAQLERRMQ